MTYFRFNQNFILKCSTAAECYKTGLFHLINHGFFKALLFLSAGSIIHALRDEQDVRKMGSMRFITPLSYSCIFIGSISS